MTRAKDGRDEPTTNPPPPPSYAYVHLERNCQLPNQRFFCDADQAVLGKMNWLVLRSDLY
jgi:hypothetical protein